MINPVSTVSPLPDATDQVDGLILAIEEALAKADEQKVSELLSQALPLAERSDSREGYYKCLALRARYLHERGKSREALESIETSLVGYRSLNQQRGIAMCLNTRGIILDAMGKYSNACINYRECLEILRVLDLKPPLAQVYSNLGLSFTYIGDYESALTAYLESLVIWDDLPINPGKAHAYTNLGMTYSLLDKPQEAITNLNASIAVCTQVGLSGPQVVSWVNLSDLSVKFGDLKLAEEQLNQADYHAQKSQEPAKIAHVLGAKSVLYIAKGEFAAAHQAVDTAIELYRTLELARGVALSLKNKAGIPDVVPAEAETLLLQAKKIAGDINVKPLMIDVLEALQHLAIRNSDWEKAYQFLLEKGTLEKALVNERSTVKLHTLNLELELDRSRRQTETQRAHAEELAKALAESDILRQRADEENRQKSEILRFAAHDLRNLLAAVLGPAELVWDDVNRLKDQPFLQEMAGFTLEAAKHMNDTLGSVLDASAIESGTVHLHKVPVVLHMLARQTQGLWQPYAAKKRQNLVLKPGGESLTVLGDQVRLLDCFNNLISNAIKYSRFDTDISIEVYSRDEWNVFSVTDCGPGISAEDRVRLGRPFQRLSAVPTGGESSFGIGLFIVKSMAIMHGGMLEISNNVPRGSTFRICLPKLAEGE